MSINFSFSKTLANAVFAFTGLLGASSVAHSAVIHEYGLNGSFTDSLGGPSLAATSASGPVGTLTGSEYRFSGNQGLTLSNWVSGAATSGNYTIEMRFRFDKVSGYNRTIAYKGRTTDAGSYVLNGNLNFFPLTSSLASPVTPDNYITMFFARNGSTGTFQNFVRDVTALSFSDTGSNAVFSQPNNEVLFFIDDTVVPNEVSAGAVDYIRFYDTALTEAQVTCIFSSTPGACGQGAVTTPTVPPVTSSVPIPGTLILLGSLLGLIGVGTRSRQ
jgi:hypothetical protein